MTLRGLRIFSDRFAPGPIDRDPFLHGAGQILAQSLSAPVDGTKLFGQLRIGFAVQPRREHVVVREWLDPLGIDAGALVGPRCFSPFENKIPSFPVVSFTPLL